MSRPAMSQSPPETPIDPLDEELLAYLDGELSVSQREAVEQQLADDPAYRHRLQSLQQAWDMLDLLPSATPSEAFTSTTVAMTIQSAREVAETQLLQLRRQRSFRWLLQSMLALAAAMLAYTLVMLRLDAPNRRLMDDLPVIERVDEYRAVDDLEFLQQLHRAGLFPEGEEVSDHAE